MDNIMDNINELIEHVKRSKADADENKSKLSKEILQLDGMSGTKTRHFYNNLCSFPGCKYIEVGSWKGSTLISALYKNNDCTGVAVDNWSEFGGPIEEFKKNCQLYIPDASLTVMQSDCFAVDIPDRKFNVYLFDGAHDYESQKKAITYFYKYLDFPCVVIIDDWNRLEVRDGTFAGIATVSANVAYEGHVRLTTDNRDTYPPLAKVDYHNGMGLFVLDKTVKKML